jgi:SAM-dependent methyltransferase
LGEFTRDLVGYEGHKPCVLDMGPTSPANIAFLAERNLRIYNEDILRAATDTNLLVLEEDGAPRLNSQKFFAENMTYPDRHFEAILCWDTLDYIPEELVNPLVEKMQSSLQPKGRLFAFFHTRDAGPESPHCRYHIVQPDTLELEPGTGLRIQRIFNNRHVENMFKEFASRKFFLGRDNIREVIMVR